MMVVVGLGLVENGSGGVTGPRRRREAAYCGSRGSAVGAEEFRGGGCFSGLVVLMRRLGKEENGGGEVFSITCVV